MPRNWPTALVQELQSPAASVALLFRIERRDGQVLGFTNWDESLTFGALTYTHDEGLKMSAITSSIGAGNDLARAKVLLDVSAVTEDDLKREIYKGARYEVRVCLVSDPNVNGILASGYFGGMIVGKGEADIENRSLTSLLKRKRGDLSSKTCRCRRLGDLQCKLDLNGTVRGFGIQSDLYCVGISGKSIEIEELDRPDGFYAFGTVQAISGPNAGVVRDVKTSSGPTIVLREAFPLPFEGEFPVRLTAGCNRLLRTETGVDTTEGSTCTQFGNANNYHGEWYLPGNGDVLKTAGND